jgi:hypothetical protein
MMNDPPPKGSEDVKAGAAGPCDDALEPRYTSYRCPACQYALWDLKARECPECGRGFRPSDFRFTPGSVRFRCPHCAHAYYGMDRFGHLVPRSFACVSCASAITQDEMIVSLREDVPERETATSTLPWLSREIRGRRRTLFRCWLSTVGWSMAGAYALGKAIASDGRATPRRAFWFAFIMICTPIALWSLALAVVILSTRGSLQGFARGAEAEVLVTVAAVPIMLLLIAMLWALLAHAVLWATGPQRGLGRTFQGVMYSTGPAILLWAPCLGFYAIPIVLIWSFIAAILAVGRAHGIGPWRPLLAMIFPLVLIVSIVVWFNS